MHVFGSGTNADQMSKQLRGRLHTQWRSVSYSIRYRETYHGRMHLIQEERGLEIYQTMAIVCTRARAAVKMYLRCCCCYRPVSVSVYVYYDGDGCRHVAIKSESFALSQVPHESHVMSKVLHFACPPGSTLRPLTSTRYEHKIVQDTLTDTLLRISSLGSIWTL